MHIEDVEKVVGDTPHMSPQQARRMTDHILEHRPKSVIELGFRHGVSSCYIAAALDELGEGHLTTVDRLGARSATPNIEELLEQLGLRDRVTVFYEPTSYTWRLMRMLETDPQPRFDLCYLDGAHSWFVDALAFLLVDRLLDQDAWLILDDLNWTYADSPSLSRLPETAAMPEDERTTAQVRKVWELLVMTDPDYTDLSEEGSWAFARKLGRTETRELAVRYVRERYGAGEFLSQSAKRLLHLTRSARARR